MLRLRNTVPQGEPGYDFSPAAAALVKLSPGIFDPSPPGVEPPAPPAERATSASVASASVAAAAAGTTHSSASFAATSALSSAAVTHKASELPKQDPLLGKPPAKRRRTSRSQAAPAAVPSPSTLTVEEAAAALQTSIAAILRPDDGTVKDTEEDDFSDHDSSAEHHQQRSKQLQHMSSLDRHVITEDCLEGLLGFLRKHVLLNVLVFRDGRLRQLHRPDLNEQGAQDQAQAPSSKKLSRRQSREHGQLQAATPASDALLSRMEAALHLLAVLVGNVRMQPNLLLPMLRVACHALTTRAGTELLQLSAIELLVVSFQNHQTLRQPIMEEIVSGVLPNVDPALRSFPVGDYHMHMVSALLLQMLQASTVLPEMDTSLHQLQDCIKVAWTWADTLWSACFSRLPGSRTSKASTDVDMRQLLDTLLSDMLMVMRFPEWPAAAAALTRFVLAVTGHKGLQHAEHGVRQCCVDLLGTLVSQLYFEASEVEREAPRLTQLAGVSGEALAEEQHQQLLVYLLHGGVKGSSSEHRLRRSAREHMLCRELCARLTEIQRAGGLDENILLLLGQYRDASAQDDITGTGPTLLSAGDAIKVAQAVVQRGQLGSARAPLLSKLIEATQPSSQASTTRAKAVKALANVIKADSRLLEAGREGGPVLMAISAALKDDAPSVRQAVVDVLGSNIGLDAQLASAYFDVVRAASADPFPSVRRAAIKILWESCIAQPGFERANEACVAVLRRVGDSEDSIQDLVGKVFHSLWFADAGANGNTQTTTTAQDGGNADSPFPFLIALHALCLTDAGLCIPQEDPERVCRCLGPYMRSSTTDRRAAEQLMCILHIVEGVLLKLGHVSKGVEAEIQSDLTTLIARHTYLLVVKAACRCFGALASVSAASAQLLASHAAHFYAKLQAAAVQGLATQAESSACVRNLFVLGHILQYGLAAVEGCTDGAVAGREPVTADSAMLTFIALFRSSAGLQVRTAALHALGCLSVACPAAMLGKDAREVMGKALNVAAASGLKIRALSNLHEMMQEEEEAVVAGQRAADAVQAATSDSVQLKVENGEGDSLSVSGGIIQEHWGKVLDLATQAPSLSVEPADAASVRRHAVNVMDAVQRNGLAPPWDAIPHLVAATTDCSGDVAARALEVLTRINEKQPDMLQRLMGTGLDVAVDFHTRLQHGTSPLPPGKLEVAPEALKGLASLYTALLQPRPAVRLDFLQRLIKRADSMCAMRGGKSGFQIRALAFCVHVMAALPFSHGDEPCAVIHAINTIIAGRGEGISAALRHHLGTPDGQQADAGAQQPDVPMPEAQQAEAHAVQLETGNSDGIEANPDDTGAPAADASPPSYPSLAAACTASLAASLLLLLKRYIMTAYCLSTERAAAYHPADVERRKAEEGRIVQRRNVRLEVDQLRLDAASGDAVLAQQQYEMFLGLMDADSAGYEDGLQSLPSRRSSMANGDANEAQEEGHTSRTASNAGKTGTGTGRGRGRGSTAPRTTGARGGRSGGRGSTARGRGRGKRRRTSRAGSSSDEADQDEDETDVASPDSAPKNKRGGNSTRKKLDWE
ncbi:hypothetical protein WJX73_010305 [Symbiochloris irregularis]|uniref:Sister chromatid cohesion protein n=1 Tax=Symbiochloris irregularis TaxID=706552 RepID=A0AAW1NWR8_9CHLO